VLKHTQSKNGFGPNHLLVVNALHQKAMMLFASPKIQEWVYSCMLMLTSLTGVSGPCPIQMYTI